MNEMVVHIIQVTYTTLLPLVLGYIVKVIKDIRNEKNVGKQADMMVLRLILMDMHDRYVNQGYVTHTSFTTFNEIWDLYHDKYKGNHLTEKFKEEVDKLPIRDASWECEETI